MKSEMALTTASKNEFGTNTTPPSVPTIILLPRMNYLGSVEPKVYIGVFCLCSLMVIFCTFPMTMPFITICISVAEIAEYTL